MENIIKELEQKLLRKEQECENNKIVHQMELDIYNQECLNLQEELKAKEQKCERLENENKRLEAENEDLKIYIESNEQQVKEVETLVMDNDRLINELDQLKQTLAEIKKLAEKEFCRHPECCEFCAISNDCLNQKIIEKINEVEDALTL